MFIKESQIFAHCCKLYIPTAVLVDNEMPVTWYLLSTDLRLNLYIYILVILHVSYLQAKSRIQCNISRQLEALRNREVWLLNQLDVVSSAKEEVLQQQSARLNQTLGVIQSSLQFPDNSGDSSVARNLAKYVKLLVWTVTALLEVTCIHSFLTVGLKHWKSSPHL